MFATSGPESAGFRSPNKVEAVGAEKEDQRALAAFSRDLSRGDLTRLPIS